MPKSKRRLGLAIALFFLAPLVAEFLLGNLPITMLGALVVLAPLYGGGALLIRESVRRTGRGWPSIVILGVAYGIFEEAFTTQSLFNPNYLGLNLHLLDAAYIPAFASGAWWTVFVLTIHAAWSISTSIALMEAFAPENPRAPWLGRVGLTITGLLFLFGAAAATLIGYRQDHFLASPAQLISAAVICVLLVFIAFRAPSWNATANSRVPSPWLAGVFTFIAGSAVLLVPKPWGWGAAFAILAIDGIATAAVLFWSRSLLWSMRHKLALAAGAALAYGWHSFVETPAVGQTASLVRVGNAVFVAAAVALIIAAAARNRRSKPASIPEWEAS
jgi:hypothetical protein